MQRRPGSLSFIGWISSRSSKCRRLAFYASTRPSGTRKRVRVWAKTRSSNGLGRRPIGVVQHASDPFAAANRASSVRI
jgi:hypothetical protein